VDRITAPAADDPVDLAGPVTVTTAISSSAPSMHLVAKLVDVPPDGPALRLLMGARLVPSADYGQPVSVRLGHTGYRVRPGHRLRVEIASSCYPFFELHPGTGEDPWTAVDRQPASVELTDEVVRLKVTALDS